MEFSKVIELFLVDGDPNKRWICELSNWTGKAFKIPRNMIQESRNRPELFSPGIYFLFGYDDENNRQLIYIGEAEKIIERLEQHLAKKDNWIETIAIVSKDSNLNKAHIKYLEFMFYSLAKESGRYSIDNKKAPTKSTISEADEAKLEEFIYNTKILVNALGHKVFEPITNPQNNNTEEQTIFSLSTDNGKAYMIITSDGFVLQKGSSIHINSASSLSIGIKKKIEQCRINKEIIDNILQKDKLFSSASSAAAFAVGYSVNGREAWRSNSGITLNEYESNKKS
ncbi:GIY-YIG nuclease family protein [Ruminococcus flavefaciens]|uniref:GIY-YIG nuclease family protein n=1 Tax=Ruminococcus flavefaciens TaxID=1265 RepID=UPI0002EB3C30|nr:GIY-YIG nuclease family protein [Ruminococcus flavefaciens]